MGTGEFNAGGNPAMDQHLIQGEGEGGVAILLVALNMLREPETVSLTFYFNCSKEKFKQQIIPGTLHVSVSKYVEGIPST